jgi:hypothetical protein
MPDPLLVDLGPLSCGCSNHVLGLFSKALAGEGGDAADIWAAHDSPFVRSLIELFSKRGLLRWIAGDRYVERQGTLLARPELHSLRLDSHELALVKIYLENIPPAEFGMSEWGMLVDYVISRYMPYDALQTEASWLAVRSTYMGKVQAQGQKISFPVAEFLPPKPIQAVLDYGFARCADNIQNLSETVRHQVKQVILEHQQEQMLGAHPPKQALKQALFDQFAAFNRDWRKIALTEVAEMEGNGLIASLKPGTRVQRLEMYSGVCSFCERINGSIFTVVDPAKPDKDGAKEVWTGKSNVGRSGARRKRTDEGMVEREDGEKWWVTAGPIHPHCRGHWLVLPDQAPAADPTFANWLDAHFAKHRKLPLAGDPNTPAS